MGSLFNLYHVSTYMDVVMNLTAEAKQVKYLKKKVFLYKKIINFCIFLKKWISSNFTSDTVLDIVQPVPAEGNPIPDPEFYRRWERSNLGQVFFFKDVITQGHCFFCAFHSSLFLLFFLSFLFSFGSFISFNLV